MTFFGLVSDERPAVARERTRALVRFAGVGMFQLYAEARTKRWGPTPAGDGSVDDMSSASW